MSANVQYGKIARGCVVERLIQYKAKPSAMLGSLLSAIFYILHSGQCFNWFIVSYTCKLQRCLGVVEWQSGSKRNHTIKSCLFMLD